MLGTGRASTFSGQVAAIFGTQVLGAGLGVINGILLARLLGPAAKGDYYLIVLLPSTAIVLVQLGLPQAFGFFAARGQTRGLVAQTVALTAALSLLATAGVIVILPLLQKGLLGEISPALVALGMLSLPLALNSTLTTGIVIGLQWVRWYSAVNVIYPIATTALLVVVLGLVAPTVGGALVVYLATAAIQSVGLFLGALRATRDRRPPAQTADGAATASYRELLTYGLVYYPASIAGFFGYRIDAYLIAFLVPDAAAPLGYYSMAVGLAEMVFLFPKAVWTMFFPHVASATREDADRHVPMVCRVTLLVTAMFAVLLVPAAAILLWALLPAFIPSFGPLLVLLPGVVVLSSANVVGGYLRGIGRPGLLSAVNVVAFLVNLVANLILIPQLGIMGAALSSLISYSLSALMLTGITSRLVGRSILDFWIVRLSDVRLAIEVGVGLLYRVLGRTRPATEDHPA